MSFSRRTRNLPDGRWIERAAMSQHGQRRIWLRICRDGFVTAARRFTLPELMPKEFSDHPAIQQVCRNADDVRLSALLRIL